MFQDLSTETETLNNATTHTHMVISLFLVQGKGPTPDVAIVSHVSRMGFKAFLLLFLSDKRISLWVVNCVS